MLLLYLSSYVHRVCHTFLISLHCYPSCLKFNVKCHSTLVVSDSTLVIVVSDVSDISHVRVCHTFLMNYVCYPSCENSISKDDVDFMKKGETNIRLFHLSDNIWREHSKNKEQGRKKETTQIDEQWNPI